MAIYAFSTGRALKAHAQAVRATRADWVCPRAWRRAARALGCI